MYNTLEYKSMLYTLQGCTGLQLAEFIKGWLTSINSKYKFNLLLQDVMDREGGINVELTHSPHKCILVDPINKATHLILVYKLLYKDNMLRRDNNAGIATLKLKLYPESKSVIIDAEVIEYDTMDNTLTGSISYTSTAEIDIDSVLDPIISAYIRREDPEYDMREFFEEAYRYISDVTGMLLQDRITVYAVLLKKNTGKNMPKIKSTVDS